MATLRERIRSMQQDPLYQKLSDEQKRWHLDQILKEYPGEKPTEVEAPTPVKEPRAEPLVARPRLVSGREGMGIFGTRVAPPPEELSPTAAVMQRFLRGGAQTATAGRVQPQIELTPEQMEIGGKIPEYAGGGAGFAVAWPGISRGVSALPGGKRLLDLARGATLRRQTAQQISKAMKRGGVPAEGAGRLIRRELLREAGLHGSFNVIVGAVYGSAEALERDDILTRLKAIGEMGAYGGAVGTIAPVIGSVINALRSQPAGPLTKEGLAALFEQYGRAAKPPPPTGVGRLALKPAPTPPTGPPTAPTTPLTPTPRPMPTGAAVPAGRPPLALTGQVGPLPPVPPGPYPLLERGAIPMPPPAREGRFPVEFPRQPITEVTPSEAVAPMQPQARDTVTRMYRQYFAPASPFRRVAGGKFGPRKSVSVEEIKRAFGDEGEKSLRDLAGVKGSKVRLRTTPKGEERYSWEKGYGLGSALKHVEEIQPALVEDVAPGVVPTEPEVPAIPPELEPPPPKPVTEVAPITDKPALVSAARRGDEIYLSFDLTAKRVPTADEIRESLQEAVPDADFSVSKFAEDLTHTARGIAKYKVDVHRQGTSDQAAATAYMDLVGQETDYVGESKFEQAIPLKDRFQKTVDVGLERELDVAPPPPEEVATVVAPTAPELPPEYSTPAAQREVIKAVKRLEGGATDMTVKADFVNTFRAWDMSDESIQRMWTEVRTQGKPLVSEAEWLEANPQYEIDVINAGSAIAETGNVDAGKDLLQGKVPEGELALAGNAAIHEALNQIYIRTDLKPETVRKLINQIDRQRGGLPYEFQRNTALRNIHLIVKKLGLDKLSPGRVATETDYEIIKLAVAQGQVRSAADMSDIEVETTLNILKTLNRKKSMGLSGPEFNEIVKLATGRSDILHASMENAAKVNLILGNEKFRDTLLEVGDTLPPTWAGDKDMQYPFSLIGKWFGPIQHTMLNDTGIYPIVKSFHDAKNHFERTWRTALGEQLGPVRWQSEKELNPIMDALEGDVPVESLTPEHQHAVNTLRGYYDRMHKVFDIPRYRQNYAPHVIDWNAVEKLLKSGTPEGKALIGELKHLRYDVQEKPFKIARKLRTTIGRGQADHYIPDNIDFFARHPRYDKLKDMLPTIRHPIRLAEMYLSGGAAWKFYNPMVNLVRPLVAILKKYPQPIKQGMIEKYVSEVIGRRAKQEADLSDGLQQVLAAVGQKPDMSGLDAFAQMVVNTTYVQYMGLPRIGSAAQNLSQMLHIIPLAGAKGTLVGAVRVAKGVDEARFLATVGEQLPAESLVRAEDAMTKAGQVQEKIVQVSLSVFSAVDRYLRRVAFSGGIEILERAMKDFTATESLQELRTYLESEGLRVALSGGVKTGSNTLMRTSAKLPTTSPLRKVQEILASVEDKGLRWNMVRALREGDIELAANNYGDYIQGISQFRYGPTDSPLMFRGPPGRMAGTFASFGINHVYFLRRLISLTYRAYKSGNYRMGNDQMMKVLSYVLSVAGLAKAAKEVLDGDIWEWFTTGAIPGRVPIWIKRLYDVGIRLPLAAGRRQIGGYEEWEEREFQDAIREVQRDFLSPHFHLGVRDIMEARDAWNKGGKDALREILGVRKWKAGEVLLPGQRGPRGIVGPKGRGLIRE